MSDHAFGSDCLKRGREADPAGALCEIPISGSNAIFSRTLSEKYRPKLFGEIIGQADAVAALRNIVGAAEQRHLIISGPRGTGKTTSARIFAKALNCKQPGQAEGYATEPCGACRSCQAIEDPEEHDAFHPVNGSGDGGRKEHLQRLIDETLAFRPLLGRRHVVFIDEAQSLSRNAQDMLLTELQDKVDVTFVFGLIDASELREQLRERCRAILLRPSAAADRLLYLTRICVGEELEVDRRALELIAERYPNFRAAEDAFAKACAAAGSAAVTEQVVCNALMRPEAEPFLAYLRALTTGDLAGQIKILRDARGTPAAKVSAIQRLLFHLKTTYVGPTLLRQDREFQLLYDACECAALVDLLGKVAARFGESLQVYFDRILEFWVYTPLRVDDVVLELHVARCNDLVSATVTPTIDVPLPAPQAAYQSSSARRKSNVRKRLVATAPESAGVYLNNQQAADIYEAATFLVQEYGVTFNSALRISMAVDAIGSDSPMDVVSELCRTLAGRLRRRGKTLHRITLLTRTSATFEADLVLHTPPDLDFDPRAWSEAFISERGFGNGTATVSVTLPAARAIENRGRSAQHWALVRRLWATVDPVLIIQGVPLLSRLGVPAHQRHPAGDVPGRRLAFSQSIGRKVQAIAAAEGMGHLSALQCRRWEMMFAGWEFQEHKERLQERSHRATRKVELETLLAEASDQLTMSKARYLLREAQLQWQVPPEQRLRRRPPWPMSALENVQEGSRNDEQ